MKVTITKDDMIRGTPRCSGKCAGARALNRAFGLQGIVVDSKGHDNYGYDYVTVTQTRGITVHRNSICRSIPLPAKLKKFMKSYDDFLSGLPAVGGNPVEFELDDKQMKELDLEHLL